MRYKINFFDSLAVDTIDVVQGDTARVLELEPNDYTIPDGATATYFVAKPSGNAVYNTATIVDNAVVVHLTAQAIAEAGKSKMQVRLTIDGELLTSFTVILAVQKFRGIDAVESTSESNIFDQTAAEALTQFEADAQEKAAETIESIPADYTTLSNTVSDLKNDLSGVENSIEINLLYGLEWVVGSVKPEDGTELSGTNRLRSSYRSIEGITKITIYPEAGYKCLIDWYDSSKQVINGLNNHGVWQTAKKTYTSFTLNGVTAKYIRILVADVNNGTVTDYYYEHITATAISDVMGTYPEAADALKHKDDELTIFHNEAAGLAPYLLDVDWINGKELNINTGKPAGDTTKFISDFIPMFPDSILNIQIPSGYLSSIYMYDENRDYIGRDKNAWIERTNDYLIYTECAYIRISVVTSTYINPIDFTASEQCKIYLVDNTNSKILSELKDRIFDNSRRISILEGGLPSYWESHLSTMVDTINGRAETLTDGDQYIFITDLHINEGNSGRYGDLIDYVLSHTSINKVICGGDMFTGNSNLTGRDAIDFLRESCTALSRNPFAKYYYILGNHDRGVVYGTSDDEATNTITKYQLYKVCGMMNTVPVTYDSQSFYRYYFDDPVSKLRYIIACPTVPATASDGSYSNSLNFNNGWVASSLLSLPSGYDAVLMTHVLWNSAQTTYNYDSMLAWNKQLCDIISAFNSRSSVTCNSVAYNFTSVTEGEVILYHGGHMHLDIEYVYNYINIVATTCDSYAQQVPLGSSGRALGNITENAFDVVTIDKTNSKIYFDRIGFGESREFTIN